MEMSEYPEHSKCPVSGSSDLRPMKGYEQHFLVKSYPLGFVFSQRIPSEKELTDHYDTYGRDDYYSPLTRKRYHELLDIFEPHRKTNKILDIGSGIGYFLEEAISRGWEAYGTEYADKAIDICSAKGIHMKQGKLNSEWYEKESFDIITSFEVIEHINDPNEEMEKIRSLLRKGGLLYITTPNFNAIERLLLKGEYNVIVYPEHLSYYTPYTLNYLLKHHGFKKKSLQTTGVSLSRIISSREPGSNYNENRPVSPLTTDERLRNSIEGNRLLIIAKHIFNRVLSIAKIGNSLKALYQKE